MTGYSKVADDYPERIIVRLDTAEHPIVAIPDLIRTATETRGMVIGDLRFDEATMRTGSVDEFAHLDLFPELYDQTTGGKLKISCAHGFQVFAPGICGRILPLALQIVEKTREKEGKSVAWGFDGAMALGAIACKDIIPVTVFPVQAEKMRDRSREKVASQFSGALKICLAALKLFPDLSDV